MRPLLFLLGMLGIGTALAAEPQPPASYTLHLSTQQLSYVLQVLRSAPLRYDDVSPLLQDMDRQIQAQQPPEKPPAGAPKK